MDIRGGFEEGMLNEDIQMTSDSEEPLKYKRYEGEVISLRDPLRVEFDHILFYKCRFIGCDFSGSYFYDTQFNNCDLSNCRFQSCYFKNTQFSGCKGEGTDFSQSTFRYSGIEEGSCHYANFSETLWDRCTIQNCDLSEAYLAEVKFKKMKFAQVDFTKVDFFKTSLDGMDLSDCSIQGIMVSDSLRELRGLKISPLQAMDLVRFLGVELT